MLQSGEEPDLTQKPVGLKTCREVLVKDLDRYTAIMREIARQKNCRHPAPTELTLDREAR
jgi:hypothetical protein